MAKNIQVNLAFSADTSQAKQQISQLQQQLSNVTAKAGLGEAVVPDIQQAIVKANELKIALNKAVNQDTGKLNLRKFAAELAQSKTSIKQYGLELAKLGPEGRAAFNDLTAAIIKSEAPLISLEGTLKKVATTLGNTVRWQLASTAINTFTSGVTSTISYAKRLDESLNNIRIVTSKTAKDMASFAKSASSAAKELSTSTTSYTNAALIFYQQGLSGKEVEERTNATIKLANVVGESAETVSEWLTSIWNNFDDGSQSLEYYADVLAKLGAATASSADEIAGGLEKFASVADTVGMSYEYAAAALTTITAKTRQSAEVVGTSMKTILARVEDLKLGDTLDDGTTLGNYSSALEKVGISIKDSNGALKDMDDILNDIGNKWGLLNRDQQVALAQSVAGIRQYSQFIAIMDNWDFMEENIETAKNATGELQQQQLIYAQSVEGAEKRLQVAKESLMNNLFDGDSLKGVLDAGATALGFVDDLVDALGGLPGILTLVSSLMLKAFGPSLFQSGLTYLQAFKASILEFSGINMKQEARNTNNEINNMSFLDSGDMAKAQALEELSKVQEKYLQNEKLLTEQQKEQYNLMLQILELRIKAMEQSGKEADRTRNERQHVKDSLDEKSTKLYEENKDIQQFAEQRGYVSDWKGAFEKGILGPADLENFDIEKATNVMGARKADNNATNNVLGLIDDIQNLQFEAEAYKEDLDNPKLQEEAQKNLNQVREQLNEAMKKFFNSYFNSAYADIDEAIDNAVSKNVETEKAAIDAQVTTDKETVRAYGGSEFAGVSDADLQSQIDKQKQEMGLTPDENADVKEQGLKASSKKTASNAARLETELAAGNPGVSKQQLKDAKEVAKAAQTTYDNYKKQNDQLKKLKKELDARKKGDQEILKKAEKTKEQIDEQTEGLKEQLKLKASADENVASADSQDARAHKGFSAAISLLNDSLDPEKGQQMANSIGGITGAAASGISSITMFATSITSLGEAIASGEAGFGDYLSSIMTFAFGLTQMISSVTGAQKALKALGLIKKKNANEAKGNAAKEKAANQEENQSNIVAIGVNLGKEASKGLKGLVIAGICAAAVAGLIGLAMSVNSASAAQADEAAAEKANEDFSKTSEEVESNASLIENYNKVLETYKTTGQEKEKLAELATQLANAYNIEGAAAAALSGNYDELTESIREARIKELETASAQADTAINANRYKFEQDMRDGTGYKSGDNYIAEFDDGGSSSDGDSIVYNIAKRYAASAPDGLFDWDAAGSGDIRIKTGLKPEEFAQAYEIIQNIVNDSIKAGVTSSSELYTSMQKWLSTSKGSYETYKNLADQQLAYKSEIKVLKAKTSSGKSIDQITTLAEYDEIEKSLMAGAESDEEKEAIGKVLDSNANIATQRTAAKARDEQIQALNGKNQEVAEKLRNAYTNATSTELVALASMSISEDTNLESFEAQFQQKLIDAQQAASREYATKGKHAESAADVVTAALQGENDKLEENYKLANKVATQAQKIYQNSQDLLKSWNSNSQALLAAKKNTVQYSYALSDLAVQFQKFFNLESVTDLEAIFDDIINKNLDLFNKFFNGEDVYTEIQKALYEGLVLSFDSSFGTQDFVGLTDEIENLIGTATGTEYTSGDIFDKINSFVKKLDPDKLTQFRVALQELTGISLEVNDQGLTSISFTDNGEGWQAIQEEQRAKKEKNKKRLEDEVERYHEIDEILSDISNDLSEIEKRKDRAFGASKLSFGEKELEKVNEELEATKKRLEEGEDYLNNIDRDNLLKWGFSLDEEGRINNYDEMMKYYTDAYNALGLSITDEQKQKYEDFKEDMEKYESTLNGIESDRLKILDLEFEIESKRLEQISTEAEIFAELREDSQAYLENMLEVLDDPAWDTAERIYNLAQQTSLAQEGAISAKDSLAKVLAEANFTEAEIASMYAGEQVDLSDRNISDEVATQIRDNVSQLYEANSTLLEMQQQIQDEILEGFNAWNEDLDEINSKLENGKSILESFRSIVETVGKDNLGITDALEEQMGEALMNNAKAGVEIARQQYLANQEALDKLRESGAADEDTLKELEDKVAESKQSFLDSWSSALEVAEQNFKDSVNRVIEAYDRAMGNLSEKSDWFEKQLTLSDFFLKEYEKTYEISKLNRKINESIDSNDSVAAQRKLRDIQQELLSYQEEGKEMSDYDLGYLQKKYDLIQAQIALEDAQNAKNTARLTRDSSGNFGYVYTADQKNVANAEQTYEDKLYQMEKYLEDSTNQLAKSWFSLNQQMEDELAAIDQTTAEGKEQAAKIVAYYSELMEMTTDEMGDMVEYGKNINEEYGTHAAETFHETVLGKMYSDCKSFEELMELTKAELKKVLDGINNAFSTLKDNVEDVMDKAGTSVKDFKDDYKTYTDEVNTQTELLSTAATNLATNFSNAFTSVVSAAATFKKDYDLQAIIDKNNAVAKSMKDILDYYGKITGKDFTKWLEGEKNKVDQTTSGKTPSGLGSESSTTGMDLVSEGYKITGTPIGSTGYKNQVPNAEYLQYEKNGYTYYVAKSNVIPEKKGDYSAGASFTLKPNAGEMTSDKFFEKKEYALSKETPYDLSGVENRELSTGAKNVRLTKNYSGSGVEQNNKHIATNAILDGTMTIKEDGSEVGFRIVSKNARESGKGAYLSWDDTAKFLFQDASNKSDLLAGVVALGGFNNPAYIEQKESLANFYDQKKQYLKDSGQWDSVMQELQNKGWVQSYDSGGYTGSWGSSGRLAMLHQKEIILNKDDTSNFLVAVDIVRSIADKLEKVSMFDTSLLSIRDIPVEKDTLQQNVTITANFPNATNHQEIELVFNDLINQTSQYINQR